MSVCSGKMLNIVPTLGIVPNRLFSDAFVIVSFTISIYNILRERDAHLSFVSYCYLAIHCFPFEGDSVLLTLRYRRAICTEFSVRASLFYAVAMTSWFRLGHTAKRWWLYLIFYPDHLLCKEPLFCELLYVDATLLPWLSSMCLANETVVIGESNFWTIITRGDYNIWHFTLRS